MLRRYSGLVGCVLLLEFASDVLSFQTISSGFPQLHRKLGLAANSASRNDRSCLPFAAPLETRLHRRFVLSSKQSAYDLNDGGKKGGGSQTALARLAQKVVRLYHALVGFLFAKLRWLSTVNPAMIAAVLFMGMIFFGQVSKGSSQRASSPPVQEVSYSRFLDSVKQGDVKNAYLGSSSVTFVLNDDTQMVTRIPRAPPDLVGYLHSQSVDFSQLKPGAGQLLVPYIGLIVYLGVVGYFGWQMFGKSMGGKVGKRVRSNQIDSSLSFEDVAGIDQAKEQVMQLVDIMQNPSRYRRLGARQPKGLLLVGPPGTGKTLLARVIAARLKLPFFFASGSDFVEMFVGRGAARVRELFSRAEKAAPCVIFLDELDALGKSRGSGMQIVRNDEGEQTLNQLLACMDGIDTQGNGIVIIAATNRYDILDEALTRPGRFDRVVRVPLPDKEGRERVLRVHAKSTRMAPSVNLGRIAEITENFSPAELSSIVNEAAIMAATKNADAVTQADLEEVLRSYKSSRGKAGLFGLGK